MTSRFLSPLGGFFRGLLRPPIFLAIVTAIFAGACSFEIHKNLESPKGRKLLFSGDTHHYLDIAKDFARGDFSMAYVERRPHRQPLYPLLLAPVYRWGGGNPALLAALSATVVYAAFLMLYAQILRRFHSRFAAALVGGLFLLYPFVREQTTDRLLSEPLHLLLMIGIIFSMLAWLERRRWPFLLLAFGLAGLDYLDRANGLFVTAAMLGALGLNEILRPPREIFANRARELRRMVLQYGSALAVFAVVCSPSWLPRLHYYGNPFYHGYLSNYMWVDTYEEGHVGQRFALYTAKDYFATHGLGDVVSRWARGFWKCGVAIPFGAENRVPILYFLALVGLGVTAATGPRSFRVLALFGFVQMLPLVWTNLSNPNVRVPLAAMLPFLVFFAAGGLTFLLERARGLPGLRNLAGSASTETGSRS